MEISFRNQRVAASRLADDRRVRFADGNGNDDSMSVEIGNASGVAGALLPKARMDARTRSAEVQPQPGGLPTQRAVSGPDGYRG